MLNFLLFYYIYLYFKVFYCNESKKKNNQARDEIFELINKDEEEQKLIDGISIEDIKDSDKKGILENINSFYNK